MLKECAIPEASYKQDNQVPEWVSMSRVRKVNEADLGVLAAPLMPQNVGSGEVPMQPAGVALGCLIDMPKRWMAQEHRRICWQVLIQL